MIPPLVTFMNIVHTGHDTALKLGAVSVIRILVLIARFKMRSDFFSHTTFPPRDMSSQFLLARRDGRTGSDDQIHPNKHSFKIITGVAMRKLF